EVGERVKLYNGLVVELREPVFQPCEPVAVPKAGFKAAADEPAGQRPIFREAIEPKAAIEVQEGLEPSLGIAAHCVQQRAGGSEPAQPAADRPGVFVVDAGVDRSWQRRNI